MAFPISEVRETRLWHLEQAIKYERKWDNVAGGDNCPERKALMKDIAYHRERYDALTKILIETGEIL